MTELKIDLTPTEKEMVLRLAEAGQRLNAANIENDRLRDGIRALHKVWFTGPDLDKDKISQACLTLFRLLPATAPLELKAGNFYRDGHGDLHGPMEERTPGVWLDEHGCVFKPDGTQWNHTPESAGNLRQCVSEKA